MFDVLGEASLGGPHSVRIVRFGPKTLLVGVSASGCQTLAELTDPQATACIAAACRGVQPPLRPRATPTLRSTGRRRDPSHRRPLRHICGNHGGSRARRRAGRDAARGSVSADAAVGADSSGKSAWQLAGPGPPGGAAAVGLGRHARRNARGPLARCHALGRADVRGRQPRPRRAPDDDLVRADVGRALAAATGARHPAAAFEPDRDLACGSSSRRW